MLTTAESFGTNLRATATTWVSNFVCGSAVLMSLMVFLAQNETHERDLDFSKSVELAL